MRCSFSQLPAGSVPHKMTAKAGEGEAAERKQRLKLLLPLLWYCLLSCAAQQQQKCLTDASSIIYGSVDVSSPLLGVRETSTSVPHCYQTYSSNKTLVRNNKECEAHHHFFCLLYLVSSQKIGDYSMHRVRAEVEAATCLWMAAKFCWFRAEKSKAGRILSGRQFTVHFHHCSCPEMNLATAFFHCEALIIERG